MDIRVTTGRSRNGARSDTLRVVFEGPSFAVAVSDDVRRVELPDRKTAWIGGEVYGARTRTGGFAELTSPAQLADLLFSNLDALEGSYVVVLVDPENGTCRVVADAFGQIDLYYQDRADGAAIATNLDLLPKAANDGAYDQIALAHALTVYGCRPAKCQTLYSDVRRVGVDETVAIRDGRFELEPRPFRPVAAGAFDERELREYGELLLEAVRLRGSIDGNVVYLSSGWDSTAILACLVHLFGSRRVRAVIGRMTYADRSGVINQFELDRARAVADFFGVSLEIVEFDYCRRGPEIVEQLRPLFRSHHIASLTGINHALLAECTARTGQANESVFAGEISDGAHNLGFSQFVTIFHPVLEFREYSDKMASYLFGPTALRLLKSGKFESDPIYQLFRSRAAADAFEAPGPEHARAGQLLASFFLRSNRLPLWSLKNVAMLTEHGREAYQNTMAPLYLDEAAREATPETLYSWYLHLYNSFHWQGSTVATLALTARAQGLRPALPFWDGRVQNFLSAMPESWGRGLDLNPTKYPLKWMLKHRIRYPMHLQVGPHSYLYDIDPGFSHSAEVLYGSTLGHSFKSALRARDYRNVLSPEVFHLPYIDAVVDRYLTGTEVRGSELNDLMALSLATAFGWFESV
jgi:hypothetical protein